MTFGWLPAVQQPSALHAGVSGQPDAELSLEYVQNNPNADEDESVTPFTWYEGKIAACFRDALPDRIDPEQDQGRLDLLIMIGPDGYPSDVRVHGLNESVEAYEPCFVRVMGRLYYGDPYGHPAAVMGRYTLAVPSDAPVERRPPQPPRARVYPRLRGRTPDDGDMAQIFVLVRLRQIDRCYDEFLERKHVSGSVELHAERTRRGAVTVKAKASTRALRPVADCVAEVATTWPLADVVRRREPLYVEYDLRADAPPRQWAPLPR